MNILVNQISILKKGNEVWELSLHNGLQQGLRAARGEYRKLPKTNW